MDFGEILKQWEKGRQKKRSDHIMDNCLDDYLPTQKDTHTKETGSTGNSTADLRKKLLAMKPQRTIDLHGLTGDEAVSRLERFIGECRRDNIKKVLIIHGKGNHSKTAPVLGKKIRQYLEQCPHTGASGVASKNMGGYGALWVLLR
ncbi:MAG: Smr/MutS family protein [Spirochaetales bacterium]|nr:Smr/MutS family protein [Spirochaetales bacterium]